MSRSPESPGPPRSQRSPGPHPLIFQVANLDGSLKPEFQEWEELLPLEPDSLVPEWFPGEFEGQTLSLEDREQAFREYLEAAYQGLKWSDSRPSRPASGPSLLHPVLRSLLMLRSVMHEDPNLAKD